MLKYKNNINEIGIDEAGRGPLIGRVYAGAVIWHNNLDNDLTIPKALNSIEISQLVAEKVKLAAMIIE